MAFLNQNYLFPLSSVHCVNYDQGISLSQLLLVFESINTKRLFFSMFMILVLCNLYVYTYTKTAMIIKNKMSNLDLI